MTCTHIPDKQAQIKTHIYSRKKYHASVFSFLGMNQLASPNPAWQDQRTT